MELPNTHAHTQEDNTRQIQHECFSVFHKLGEKRQESSERNYYIISLRVIIIVIIIML